MLMFPISERRKKGLYCCQILILVSVKKKKIGRALNIRQKAATEYFI